MANLKALEKKQLYTILISLGILLWAVFSIFIFRLNLGIDFASSNTIVLQLDHTELTDSMKVAASKVFPVSLVERTTSDKYYLSYQNVTTDNLNSIMQSLGEEVGGILDMSVYQRSFQMEYFLQDRLGIMIGIFILLGLIYYALSLRGKNITRGESLEFVFTEFITNIFGVIVILGMGSFFGAMGVIMDNEYFSLLMLSLGVFFVMRIYLLAKTADYVLRNTKINFDSALVDINDKYRPEIIFIISVVGLFVVLPLFVLTVDVFLSSLLIIAALLIALFSQLYLSPVLYQNFKKVLKIKKTSFLNRNW